MKVKGNDNQKSKKGEAVLRKKEKSVYAIAM